MSIFESHERMITNVNLTLKMVIMGIVLSMITGLALLVYRLDRRSVETGKFGFPEQAAAKYFWSGVAGRDLAQFIRIEADPVLIRYLMDNGLNVPRMNGLMGTYIYYPDVIDAVIDDQLRRNAPVGRRLRRLFSFGGIWRLYGVWILVFFMLYLAVFYVLSKRAARDKFLRGARMIPVRRLIQNIKKEHPPEDCDIHLDDIPLPREVETQHMMVLGTISSGKTTIIMKLLDEVLNKKDRRTVIIYDSKGEYTEKFYRDDGSFILFNPMDTRSVRYSIYNDIYKPVDYELITRSLCETTREGGAGEIDKFWSETGAKILYSMLKYVKKHGNCTNKEVYLAMQQERGQIMRMIDKLDEEDRGAKTYISESKMGASVLSEAMRRMEFLKHLPDGPFSFKEFIRDCRNRVLILQNPTVYKSINSTIIKHLITLMIQELMTMPDDLQRRVFFFLDEIDTLPKMEELFYLQKVGRSKGGAVVIGTQDLGNMNTIYGKNRTQSFVNNTNTFAVGRLNDPDTARYMSEKFGRVELIRSTSGSQVGPGVHGDRLSRQDQIRQQELIMSSGFLNMHRMNFILSVSHFGITRFKTEWIERKQISQGFIDRN